MCAEGRTARASSKGEGWRHQWEGKGDRGARLRKGEARYPEGCHGPKQRLLPGLLHHRALLPLLEIRIAPLRSRPSEPALPSSSELPQPGTPPAVVSRTPTEHRMSPPGMVRWGHWWGGASQDLEWGPQVGPESPAAALGVDPLPAPPQDDVDFDVDQQRDDEGHVEGDYGGVDHEGRVGDDALALLWRRESPRRASQHHAVEALSPS